MDATDTVNTAIRDIFLMALPFALVLLVGTFLAALARKFVGDVAAVLVLIAGGAVVVFVLLPRLL